MPRPAAGNTALRILRRFSSAFADRSTVAPSSRVFPAPMLDPNFLVNNLEAAARGAPDLEATRPPVSPTSTHARRRAPGSIAEGGLASGSGRGREDRPHARRRGRLPSQSRDEGPRPHQQFEDQLEEVKSALDRFLLSESRTSRRQRADGQGRRGNVEVRGWASRAPSTSSRRPHWELGERARHPRLRAGREDHRRAVHASLGRGAALERALISFMLDLHTREHGYTEMLPPFIVNSPIADRTGQLPKFEQDLFRLAGLRPTT